MLKTKEPIAMELDGFAYRWALKIFLSLNRLFRPFRDFPVIEDYAGKSPYWMQEVQLREGQEKLEGIGSFCDLKGKVILDVGCGTGGKTIGYALGQGRTTRVIGVDISLRDIQVGKEFEREKGLGSGVTFIVCDASHLPFKDGSIDMAISTNAFEHVHSPAGFLEEVSRVLKGGGYFFVSFNPLYYSPYGPHLWDYLRIPWIHLLASYEFICQAYREIIFSQKERISRLFDYKVSDDDLETFIRDQLHQFRTLNRLTPRKFKALFKRGGKWQLLRFEVGGLRRLRPLVYLPFLSCLFIVAIDCVLRRERGRQKIGETLFLRYLVTRDLRRLKERVGSGS